MKWGHATILKFHKTGSCLASPRRDKRQIPGICVAPAHAGGL